MPQAMTSYTSYHLKKIDYSLVPIFLEFEGTCRNLDIAGYCHVTLWRKIKKNRKQLHLLEVVKKLWKEKHRTLQHLL